MCHAASARANTSFPLLHEQLPNITQTDAVTAAGIGATPLSCDQNQCYATCVGYDACRSCYSYCHVASPKVGGDGLAVFLLFLPIIVLLFLTLKPNPWYEK